MTVAILAGGQARRMGGQDKSLLSLAGRPILDWQLDALYKAGAASRDIFVVATNADRFVETGLRVVADLRPGTGALGGLYTALCASDASSTIVLACDLPFVTGAFLRWLDEVGREADATVPRTADGYQPLCASYTAACIPVIERRLDAGNIKVTDFLRDIHVRELGPDEVAPYDPQGRLFFNVNTPEGYDAACRLAGPASVPSRPVPRASYRSTSNESNVRKIKS